jgi:hypothetical protein
MSFIIVWKVAGEFVKPKYIFLAKPVIRVDNTDGWDRPSSELPDNAGDGLRMLTLHSGFFDAGHATGRASAHLDLPGIPVDLGVMLPEPGVPEDEFLLAEPSDGELNSLAVTLVMEDQSCNISDEASLIGRAVHIEHRDGL